ncbi:MAG: prepilin-type N-terminal cleavage/methylation domain-containing protein [Phycisphaerales bacterium]|nr:prepilin-type N-terminal cleavage/methylation domain-containing protein [Phycisphaerales bacterium]
MGPSTPNHGAGFTLIELVVVLGIVMVVLGLALPGLAASRTAAQLTRDAAAMRSMASAVFAYAAESGDYFPGRSPSVIECYRNDWHDVLVATGHSDNSSRLMPSKDGVHRVYMMGAAFAARTEFDPARPSYWYKGRAQPQRMRSVLSPSSKAMLVRATRVNGRPEDRSTWWCCINPKVTVCPLVFCDGSVSQSDWRDLYMSSPPIATTFQGYPLYSTWSGTAGRDRP